MDRTQHQQKPHLYDVYKNFILNITIYRLKLQGYKKIYLANTGVTILTSKKVIFRAENITRDKEGHYIMLGQFTNKTKILNAYAPKL